MKKIIQINFLQKFFLIPLLIIIWLHSSDLAARPIISGISTNKINIDTNFDGAEILLFGARDSYGDVIIAVRGPKKKYLLSKMGHSAGIWHNETMVKFRDAYSYYAFFSSDHTLDEELLSKLEVGQNNIKFDISGKLTDAEKSEFKNEFIAKLEKDGLYSTGEAEIEFLDETLFKVTLKFPKSISSGVYTVEIYLTDDNNLSAFQSIPIYVNQVGLSAKINDMAHIHSVLYGIIAILIAVISGLIANVTFNKFFGH